MVSSIISAWAGTVDSVSRVNKEIAESVSLANLKKKLYPHYHYSSMQVVDESQFLRCSIAESPPRVVDDDRLRTARPATHHNHFCQFEANHS